MLIKLIVCFVAGIGAGLGTGFAGMSAAAVISPMLITFLDMDPYMAVGIALASDVLASAVSAYTYGKNRNLDIKNGLIMMFTVLCFTMVGSYLASLLPSATLGGFSTVMTLLVGIKFIVKPVMTTKEAMAGVSAGKRAVQSVVAGIIIGLICVLMVKLLIDWYLKTKSGLLLRAVGDNQSFVTSLGKDQGSHKILGLALGNGLVSLSGCVLAQQAESANISSGTGMVVMALASVIIGRTLFGRIRIMKSTTSAILGACIYKACLAIAMQLGLPTNYLKLLMAVLFTAVLISNNFRRKSNAKV